ncbi:MAG: TonB-dependent receptor [Candidatus Neomarinimicrobiota bacterium]|nr:TonB-dependent receptor [Candidatus Neomarinimicrobiota bacterium]
MSKIKFFKYSLLVLVCCLKAQTTSSINGFVRNDATGEPISYANVFLANTSFGAATNQDGYFVITNIPPGSYEINASMIGYGIYKEKIMLFERETIRLDIRLREEAIQSEEILVTAERQKFERSMESSQISLGLREINSAPAFVEPDVFRTLQMLPGVQTTSDFSSALYVRGSTPDQNLIMLDGIAIYNPYHLGGIFSTFNTDAIKEADFHAGGFPARYGGRMGAILNVINREGNTQKITGSANLSLISSKALLEGPIPKWKGMKGSWMISGRRTYFDTVINALEIPTGQQRSDGSDVYFEFPYYFYDYQIKINLDLNPDHRLTYSRFYGDDVLDFSWDDTQQTSNANVNIQSDFNTRIDWPWGNHTNGLTWRWIVSPEVVAKTFYSNSRYRFDFDLSFQDRDTYTYADSTVVYFTNFNFEIYDIINDHTLETEIAWKINDNQEITGGFQIKDVKFDLGIDLGITSQDTSLTYSPLSLKNTTKEIAFFIQDKLDISEKLKFQGGIRATDYNLHDQLYLDPRLGMKYHYSDNVALKLNWGLYHQFLTTANNQDENLRLVELWLGIPEDKPASIAQHIIAGIEYMSPKNIFYRLEVYQKEFDNLLTLKQDNPTTVEGDDPDSTLNDFWDTNGQSRGVEFLLKKSSGRFNGWVGYTYAETEYYTEPNGWHHPNFDRTHTLNVVGNFELNQDLEISTAVTNSSGNPYTKILGRVYDWEQNLTSNMYWYPIDSYIVGEKNTERYDGYFRVDVGMIRKGGNLFGLEYDTYWQIMNLTRHLNTLNYTYRTKTDPLTGNRLGVERRPIPMFPLILTFGIKFEF